MGAFSAPGVGALSPAPGVGASYACDPPLGPGVYPQASLVLAPGVGAERPPYAGVLEPDGFQAGVLDPPEKPSWAGVLLPPKLHAGVREPLPPP